MKKILSTLLSIFLLGIMGMSATVYTHTIGKSDFHDGKSQQTANMTGVNWTLDMQNSTYIGTGSITSKGIQLGKSKQAFSTATLTTSEIPGTIKGITINTSGAKDIDATVSVKVNGVSLGTEQKITSSAADYTFTGAQNGTIEILWTNNTYKPSNGQGKAIYLKSITVEYEESASSNKVATPKVTPASGTYPYGTLLEISCETQGAEIEIISSHPGGGMTRDIYTNPIPLTSSRNISVTARKNGMEASNTVNFEYIITEAAKYGYKRTVSNGKRYLLVDSDIHIAQPLDDNGKDFGYLTVVDQKAVDGYISLDDDRAGFWIYIDTDGTGTIQDYNHRYYYMTAEHNSFQLLPRNSIPTFDISWKFELQQDGTMKITNVATGKWIQYNSQYHSFGAYNTEQGSLPKLYEEGAVADRAKIPALEFSPASGAVKRGTQVTIVCSVPDATVKYKMNAGTFKEYTGPITINEQCSITAYAEKTGWDRSDNATAEYSITEANPLEVTFDFTNPETLNPSIDRNTLLSKEMDITTPFEKDGIKLIMEGGTKPRLSNNGDYPHLRFFSGDKMTFECTADEVLVDRITIEGTLLDSFTANEGNFDVNSWDSSTAQGLVFPVILTKKSGKGSDIKFINVLKKIASEVESSEISVVSIFGTTGGVEISGVDGWVEVYNVYGQQVAREYVSGNATVNTPAGLMIVKAGDTVAKVLVK